MSISESARADGSPSDRLRQLLSRAPVRALSPEQARNVLAQCMKEAAALPAGRPHNDGLALRSQRQVFLTAGPMPPWQAYQSVLQAIDVDAALIGQVRGYWRAAMVQAANGTVQTVPIPRPHRPAVVTRDDELRARTPAEFATLLRLLRVRSGVGPSEISRRSTIARSQIYELIKAGRTTLPTRSTQVTKFARACGLTPDKVTRLTELWSELAEQAVAGPQVDETPTVGLSIAPVVDTPPPPPPAIVEPARPGLVSPLVGWALLGLVTTGVVIAVLLICHATTLKTVVTTAGAVLLPVIVVLVAVAFLIPISRALSVISNIDIEYRPSRSTGRWSYRLAFRHEPRQPVVVLGAPPERDQTS